MQMKYIVALLIITAVFLPAVSAELYKESPVAIKVGTTTKDVTSITMDKGNVTFTATDTKLAATTATLIDGKLFTPSTTTEKSTSLAWETPDAKMEYTYTGKTLKETITLKEDKKLSFPITLAKDSKLIPWENGQWKIVSSVTGNTMAGVVLEKPYGIDANGNRIEMVYTYKDGILNLEYNREVLTYKIPSGTQPNGTPYTDRVLTSSAIAYPLVIDPTWVSVGGGAYSDTTTVAGYNITMWNTTGKSSWTVPTGVTSVEYLVVGGGGSGGNYVGGGGGAGGFRTAAGFAVSAGTALNVTVGTGGAAISGNAIGEDGKESVFSTITAYGGGGGGKYNAVAGRDGGSGGGAESTNNGVTLDASYGNNGGDGTGGGYCGGGGGGKGAVGGAAGSGGSCAGGNGGAGQSSSINGSAVWYAAGGGGAGRATAGSGGSGIGGNGGKVLDVTTSATGGAINTGSGGGGSSYSISAPAAATSGAGGSGVVILKFAIPATPGLSISASPTSSATYATYVNVSINTPSTLPTNWTFGDTYTSQTQNNAYHFYSVAGNYTVNISLTNTSSPYGFRNASTYFNQTSDSDGNLKSWMHMNGVAGGTTFQDLMGNAWTPSSVTTQTATKKFGTASALFNANGDRLQTPSSTQFDFGTGNFTIEQWVYPTSSSSDDFILSRTTNAATKSNGWGIYHSTAAADSSGWVMYLGTTAVQTGTFTLPLNTWSHLAIQRSKGVVNVSVNGLRVTGVTAAGNYDTTNAIAYGDPIAGAGTSSAKMYLDEARISNTLRWNDGGVGFSTPYAEYVGDLAPLYINKNPNSTLRFKTNPSATPPGNVLMTNLTMRNRTIQIQNVTIAANLSAVTIFNPNYFRVMNVYANNTHFAGINITKVVIDNNEGTVLVNATRTGGFSTTALTESRGSIFDVQMLYWNYTPPRTSLVWDDSDVPNRQYFGSGYLKNGTSGFDFPVVNFYPTNVSVVDWITMSNFTANNKTPYVDETNITFASLMNVTANRYIWNFGDNTTQNSTNGLAYHIYTTPGVYSVSSQAYLWQNNTVSNYTILRGTINATYNPTYVNANFTCAPISGTTGLFVYCTDESVFGSTTYGKTYNWSWGDNFGSLSPYSDTIGDASHVYAALGTFSVALRVNNTYNTDTMTRTNYITISNSQQSQTTFYSPHQVTFRVMDMNDNIIKDAFVNATAYESTLPGGITGATESLMEMFGINNVSAGKMVSAATNMEGYTADDGSITFTMHSSLKYLIVIDDGGNQYTKTIYPLDTYYILRTTGVGSYTSPETTYNRGSNIANSTLTFEEPNNSYMTMGVDYLDLSGNTDYIMFFVKLKNNETVIYSQNQSIVGAERILMNTTVKNKRGEQWLWWYDAHTVV